MAEVILNITVITCPYCGFKKQELMPLNACTYFYECEIVKRYSNQWRAIVVCFAVMAL